jgi:hypothetical protein
LKNLRDQCNDFAKQSPEPRKSQETTVAPVIAPKVDTTPVATFKASFPVEPVKQTETVVSAPTFSFGTTSATVPPAKQTETAVSAPTFSFGTTSVTTPPAKQAVAEPPKSTVSAPPEVAKKAPEPAATPAFSFGVDQAKPTSFSFGPEKTTPVSFTMPEPTKKPAEPEIAKKAPEPSATPAFSFGVSQPKVTKEKPKQEAFSFTPTKPPEVAKKAEPVPFSFGEPKSTVTPQPSSTSFKFEATPFTTAPPSGATPFVFGPTAVKESTAKPAPSEPDTKKVPSFPSLPPVQPEPEDDSLTEGRAERVGRDKKGRKSDQISEVAPTPPPKAITPFTFESSQVNSKLILLIMRLCWRFYCNTVADEHRSAATVLQ